MTLSPGVDIPVLGFGTGTAWFRNARGESALTEALLDALNAGFRHIDEAEMYGNETVTGAALATWLAQHATTGVSRADLFVTSKAFGCIDAPGGIAAGCRRSLANLQLGYLDLYLLHAPFDKDGQPFATPLGAQWRAMEQLVRDGLVRAIGVSNFRASDLAALSAALALPEPTAASEPALSLPSSDPAIAAAATAAAPATVRARLLPCVNQVERHLLLRQPALVAACARASCAVAAYAPLVPLTHPQAHLHPMRPSPVLAAVQAVAAAHGGCSAATVLLAWSRQCGGVTLTTTAKRERMADALASCRLDLSAGEMASLEAAADASPPLRAYWTGAAVDWE